MYCVVLLTIIRKSNTYVSQTIVQYKLLIVLFVSLYTYSIRYLIKCIPCFQALLAEAHTELVDKDREIFRLTKEVVELRLLKMDSGTDGVDSVQTDTPNRLSASHDDILTTDVTSNQSEQRAASSNGGG